MKKFFRKLTPTQRRWLAFIPFGVFCFYQSRWAGLLGSVIGWWLGGVLIRNEKTIRNFGYRKFFSKYRTPIINLLLLIPINILAYHISDLSTMAAITVGWLSGMIVWRLRKGRW